MRSKSEISKAAIVSLFVLTIFQGFCLGQSSRIDTISPAFRIVRAAATGNVQLLSSLLESDPGLINTKEPSMNEPLMVVAARNNQPGIVALLIKKASRWIQRTTVE